MPTSEKYQIDVQISPEISYPIYIDSDELSTIENKIRDCVGDKKILLVLSEKVDKLYKDKIGFINCPKFILKDGENQKNFKNYQRILNFASKNKLERKDVIVAIGGGVVGDIAGFAAATYLRGIDFIQVPTTLLACVDSSVGGKVAVNTDFGKNLVGTFYQPKAVFCNINFLKTLDDRQFKTGLAEVVKYAFIEKSCQAGENYEFFEFLNSVYDKVNARDLSVLAEIIKICLSLKASVVEKDEKEAGLRKILNFGHTLGHAIEKITNYKKYTHGEAVAYGTVFALKLAFTRNLIDENYLNQSLALLQKYSLLAKIPEFAPDKLIDLMTLDKKVEDGKIKFILPVSKSTVESFNDIKVSEIKTALKI